jgi:hypothetical protein
MPKDSKGLWPFAPELLSFPSDPCHPSRTLVIPPSRTLVTLLGPLSFRTGRKPGEEPAVRRHHHNSCGDSRPSCPAAQVYRATSRPLQTLVIPNRAPSPVRNLLSAAITTIHVGTAALGCPAARPYRAAAAPRPVHGRTPQRPAVTWKSGASAPRKRSR